MRTLGPISLCFYLVSCGVFFLASAAAQGVNETEATQLRTIEAFEAAWDRGDINAMLTFLTPDMEYVNAGNGHYWRGHEELRAGWNGVIAAGGALKPVVAARTFRQLSRDFAVVVTQYHIDIPDSQRRASDPQYLESISTFVLARQADGRWLITHSQSTLVTPSRAP